MIQRMMTATPAMAAPITIGIRLVPDEDEAPAIAESFTCIAANCIK